jgi:Cof subfamily protein (haloacid dehalogenase superfamily)
LFTPAIMHKRGSVNLPTRFDLIAIDCDGTLLDSDKFISMGAQEAIAFVQSQGVKVALVTGRNQPTLRKIIDQLNLKGPFIGSGGAYIADLATGQVIEQHTLPMPDLETIIRFCRQIKVMFFTDSADFMMGEWATEEMHKAKETHGYEWRIVPDLLQAISKPPEKVLLLGEHAELVEVYDYVKKNHLNVNIVWTGYKSMDILPAGVNKGTALKTLGTFLKIPPKRIAVIGDWSNDLDMFAVAGTSVAMGNAPDDVKQAADLVAPTNDEGGVAWALRKLMDLNEET